jgi:hypothetical protein
MDSEVAAVATREPPIAMVMVVGDDKQGERGGRASLDEGAGRAASPVRAAGTRRADASVWARWQSRVFLSSAMSSAMRASADEHPAPPGGQRAGPELSLLSHWSKAPSRRPASRERSAVTSWGALLVNGLPVLGPSCQGDEGEPSCVPLRCRLGVPVWEIPWHSLGMSPLGATGRRALMLARRLGCAA